MRQFNAFPVQSLADASFALCPAGERIRHYDVPAGDGGGGSWRQRLTAHLRSGASGGRVHKVLPCSAAAQGGCDE